MKNTIEQIEHQQGDRAFLKFTDRTKKEKLAEVGGKCEKCQKQLRQHETQFHHKVPIKYAFTYFKSFNFSQEAIKNEVNCQVLCTSCHDQQHKDDTPQKYEAVAQELYQKIEKEGLVTYPYITEKRRDRLKKDIKRAFSGNP